MKKNLLYAIFIYLLLIFIGNNCYSAEYYYPPSNYEWATGSWYGGNPYKSSSFNTWATGMYYVCGPSYWYLMNSNGTVYAGAKSYDTNYRYSSGGNGYNFNVPYTWFQYLQNPYRIILFDINISNEAEFELKGYLKVQYGDNGSETYISPEFIIQDNILNQSVDIELNVGSYQGNFAWWLYVGGVCVNLGARVNDDNPEIVEIGYEFGSLAPSEYDGVIGTSDNWGGGDLPPGVPAEKPEFPTGAMPAGAGTAPLISDDPFDFPEENPQRPEIEENNETSSFDTEDGLSPQEAYEAFRKALEEADALYSTDINAVVDFSGSVPDATEFISLFNEFSALNEDLQDSYEASLLALQGLLDNINPISLPNTLGKQSRLVFRYMDKDVVVDMARWSPVVITIRMLLFVIISVLFWFTIVNAIQKAF